MFQGAPLCGSMFVFRFYREVVHHQCERLSVTYVDEHAATQGVCAAHVQHGDAHPPSRNAYIWRHNYMIAKLRVSMHEHSLIKIAVSVF